MESPALITGLVLGLFSKYILFLNVFLFILFLFICLILYLTLCWNINIILEKPIKNNSNKIDENQNIEKPNSVEKIFLEFEPIKYKVIKPFSILNELITVDHLICEINQKDNIVYFKNINKSMNLDKFYSLIELNFLKR